MARFDIRRNANAEKTDEFPYLIEVQSDLMDQLRTRVVIPLMSVERYGAPIERLNPVLEVEGRAYVAVTSELAGVHLSALGPLVASAAERGDELTAAIDFLLQGY